MHIRGMSPDDSFELLSLNNVDLAMAPVQHVLRRLFLIAACAVVIVALLCSYASAQSIVNPVAALVAHLRKAGNDAVLPEFTTNIGSIAEVLELTHAYNRAAGSVRQAHEDLRGAYVEFVESLANALDARDRYTAGHSQRVSDLSCAVAKALGLSDEEVEVIRIGALLHDIGKIGINDAVLQKPGRLTDEEFALIKQHPVIGRHILEGVQGFAPYLAAVEFHHENWNGTGYPNRQAGLETPIEARIIHVADAYDAMTTNRSYRRGMIRDKAMSILIEHAGTQFDPSIVAIFAELPDEMLGLPIPNAEPQTCEAA
jgi:putative nucleotidyltransferase with HDIG domain